MSEEKAKDYSRHSILRFANIRNSLFADVERRILQAEAAPASTGRTLLLKFFKGAVLTSREKQIAFCCECSGYYHDGRVDCENYICPFYLSMPYRASRKKYVRKERRPKQ